MSPAAGPEEVSPSAGQRLDRACNRFEDAWAAGQRPHIEDFLGEVPEPERPRLVQELVLLEAYYRRRAGEAPALEEYRRRFPDLPQPFHLEGQPTPPPGPQSPPPTVRAAPRTRPRPRRAPGASRGSPATRSWGYSAGAAWGWSTGRARSG
jgi:hypothetical protein